MDSVWKITWNGIDVIATTKIPPGEWYFMNEAGYLYDAQKDDDNNIYSPKAQDPSNATVNTSGTILKRKGYVASTVKVNADGSVFTELEAEEIKPLVLTESQCPTCYQERVLRRLLTSDYYFCEKCNK